VVLRQGEDVARVIDAVKKKIEEVKGAFPPGLELKILYDRSTLVKEAVDTLRDTLLDSLT
jgi:copper/silver efflux system protein